MQSASECDHSLPRNVAHQGGDGSRLVPVSASEAGAAKNFLGVFAQAVRGCCRKDDMFVSTLTLVLVVRGRLEEMGPRDGGL